MSTARKVKLSSELIVNEALALIDETGDFTIPGVARRLGVRQSSLYNHVNGRGEIVELIRRRLHESMAVRIDTNKPWEVVIREVALALRSSLAKHPLMIPLLATSPANLDATITTLENCATVLSRAGFSSSDVLKILGAIDILAIGGSLDLVSPEQIYPDEVRKEAPVLARILDSGSNTPRADKAFEFTLDLLIQALRQRISSPPPDPDTSPGSGVPTSRN